MEFASCLWRFVELIRCSSVTSFEHLETEFYGDSLEFVTCEPRN